MGREHLHYVRVSYETTKWGDSTTFETIAEAIEWLEDIELER